MKSFFPVEILVTGDLQRKIVSCVENLPQGRAFTILKTNVFVTIENKHRNYEFIILPAPGETSESVIALLNTGQAYFYGSEIRAFDNSRLIANIQDYIISDRDHWTIKQPQEVLLLSNETRLENCLKRYYYIAYALLKSSDPGISDDTIRFLQSVEKHFCGNPGDLRQQVLKEWAESESYPVSLVAIITNHLDSIDGQEKQP